MNPFRITVLMICLMVLSLSNVPECAAEDDSRARLLASLAPPPEGEVQLLELQDKTILIGQVDSIGIDHVWFSSDSISHTIQISTHGYVIMSHVSGERH